MKDHAVPPKALFSELLAVSFQAAWFVMLPELPERICPSVQFTVPLLVHAEALKSWTAALPMVSTAVVPKVRSATLPASHVNGPSMVAGPVSVPPLSCVVPVPENVTVPTRW